MSEGRPPRRFLQLQLWIALALLLAALLAIGVVGAEHWLERGVVWLAARRGVALSLEVEQLGLSGAQFRNLRLGSEAEVELAHLSLDWQFEGFDGFASVRLASARLSGLRVRARIDEGGVSLGSLDAWVFPPQNPETSQSADPGDAVLTLLSALPLAGVELDDARLLLTAAEAHGEVRVDATLRGDTRSGLLLEVEWSLRDSAELARGELRVSLGHDTFEGRLRMKSASGSAHAAVDWRVLGSSDDWKGEVTLEAAGDLQMETGLVLTGTRVAALFEVSVQGSEFLAKLRDCLSISAASIQLADAFRLAAPLSLCVASGGLLTHDLAANEQHVEIEIDPAAFALELPAADGGHVDIEGETPRVRLQLDRDGQSGEIHARIRGEAGRVKSLAYGVSASDFALSGTAAHLEALFGVGGGSEQATLSLTLLDCLWIEVAARELPGALRLTAPLHLCLAPGGSLEAKLVSDEQRLQLAIESDLFSLEIPTDDSPPHEVSGEARRVELVVERQGSQGEIQVRLHGEEFRVEVPEYAVSASDITLDLTASLARSRSTARVDALVGSLRSLESPALWSELTATLAVDLELKQDHEAHREEIRFSAEAHDETGELQLTLTGVHDLEREVGQAHVQLARLSFDPGLLQPGTIFPVLEGTVSGVFGWLEADAEPRWGAEGLTVPASLEISSLSFEFGDILVEEVNAQLELASLTPLRTPEGTAEAQRIEVDRIESGMALSDVVLVFDVADDGALIIHTAECSFAEGRLRTTGRIHREELNEPLVVAVEGVDLDALFRGLAVDNLWGSGSLSGELPVVIDGEHILLDGGVLYGGSEGGEIHYQMELPAPTAEVDLAIQILKNIQFSELQINVDGDLAETIEMKISLLGRSPDVSERPVKFNLGISAPVGQIVRGAALGDVISNAIEQQLLNR